MSGSIFLAPDGSTPSDSDGMGMPPTNLPMRHLWHGWDGSTWDLSDPTAAVSLGSGVQGLGNPDIDWYTTDSPSVDGSTDRGFRVSGRAITWPLIVMAGPTQQWIDQDSAFWRTLQPGRYGVWEVQQAKGSSRTLRCRLDTDGAPTFRTDPALLKRAVYGVRLACPDPYWAGDVISQPFAPAAPQPFFGPVFTISRSSTLSSATMTNPGDVEAWPVWTIFGPTTSVTVGLNGHLVTVPFTVSAGKALIIDTDPRMQTAFEANATTAADGTLTATSTGVERTGNLGTVDFEPIPTGTSVPLSLTVVGSGSVSVSIRPRYLRAW